MWVHSRSRRHPKHFPETRASHHQVKRCGPVQWRMSVRIRSCGKKAPWHGVHHGARGRTNTPDIRRCLLGRNRLGEWPAFETAASFTQDQIVDIREQHDGFLRDSTPAELRSTIYQRVQLKKVSNYKLYIFGFCAIPSCGWITQGCYLPLQPGVKLLAQSSDASASRTLALREKVERSDSSAFPGPSEPEVPVLIFLI